MKDWLKIDKVILLLVPLVTAGILFWQTYLLRRQINLASRPYLSITKVDNKPLFNYKQTKFSSIYSKAKIEFDSLQKDSIDQFECNNEGVIFPGQDKIICGTFILVLTGEDVKKYITDKDKNHETSFRIEYDELNNKNKNKYQYFTNVKVKDIENKEIKGLFAPVVIFDAK